MWGVLQTVAVSILFIVSLHYFFQYIKNVFTPKKTTNIIDFQLQKYKSMLEEITAKSYPPKENFSKWEDWESNVPFYEPSVAGDDTQSEMGSTVDYLTMERELLEMI
jgi:hypothetical protein